MAMKLACVATRGNLFFIDPADIVVDVSFNSRAAQHTPESIRIRAESMMEQGQLTPIVLRRLPGNKVQLVYGYLRHAAVTLINSELRPGDPMKLQCVVQDMSAEEAFVKSITENEEVSHKTAIDDAHNQRRLREEYGWKDADIARLYKRSGSYVAKLRDVLQAPTVVQEALAEHRVSLNAALDLRTLPEAEIPQVMAAAEKSNGKLDATVIGKAVRKKRQAAAKAKVTADAVTADAVSAPIENPTLDNGEPSAEVPPPIQPKEKPAGKARSMRELKDFWEGLTGPAELPRMRSLAKVMLDFIGGEIADDEMAMELKYLLVNE